jgi:hypothetical protein
VITIPKKIMSARFLSALALDDVEYDKVHLPTNITPLTSTPYLEKGLEII